MPAAPSAIERFAFLGLLTAVFALALCRVDMTDTPWHLATAREAWRTGSWLNRNTFSYTHPDYPVFQQYPVYQTLLLVVHAVGSWEGLSLLHAAAWSGIFLLGVRWAGGPRSTLPLVGLLAILALSLQQRMVLRPDIVSTPLILLMLLALDRFRRSPWPTVAIVVGLEWLFANSHQLFPVGLAIQGAMLADLLVSAWCQRRPVDRSAGNDAAAGLGPVVAAIVMMFGSLAVCFLTPLGVEVIHVPAHTFGSLSHHRLHVQEFARIQEVPWAFTLMIASGIAVIAIGVRAWRQARVTPTVFETLVWLMTLALVLSAMRGIALFALVSIGLAGRLRTRALAACPQARTGKPGDGEFVDATAPSNPSTGSRQPIVTTSASPDDVPAADPASIGFRRVLGAASAILVAAWILDARWIHPARQLGGSQPGIGKSLGWWPDEAVEFLRHHRPNGSVMNLSWYTGNALVGAFDPPIPVFVDPRFEAYPRPFLLDAIEAETDPVVFDRLLDEHQPGWLFLETRLKSTRAIAKRMVGRGWTLVFADSKALIVVDPAVNGELAARFGMSGPAAEPPDLLVNHPDLARLQRQRWAAVLSEWQVDPPSGSPSTLATAE